MVTILNYRCGSILPLTGLLFLLASCSSCSLILQSKINKQFPKVSPEARKIQNIVSSTFALTQIDTASVGISIPTEKLTDALGTAVKKQRLFIINDADSIVVDTSSVRFAFKNQEIQVEAEAMVYISASSNLKTLKSFCFHIKGFVSPYFVDVPNSLNTTLHLNPNVEELTVTKLRFRSLILSGLNSIAQYIVNDFSKRFIDNVNGLLPDVQSTLNISLLYQKKYSELVNTPEIIVTHDDAIVINKKLGNKAVLIQPKSLTVIADIKEIEPPQPAVAALTIQSISTNNIDRIVQTNAGSNSAWTVNTSEDDIKKSQFNQMFSQYLTDFSRVWDLSLDSLEHVDPSLVNTQISQKFIVSFVNQLFARPTFAFQLTQQTLPTFHIPSTKIELLEKPSWDCNQIQFHCDLNDCNNVLHGCGSCSWWDVPCHIGWAACQAANGVAYAGCQVLNAAKLGVCTISYVGEKAFCFAKYAVLYAAHDLVSVGTIEGDINMAISGGGALGPLSLSNDLNSFNLNTSSVSGQGVFSGKIDYSKDWEVTLTSILQCNCLGIYVPIPIGCTFNIPTMNGTFDFPAAISGSIQKTQDAQVKMARVGITSNEIPIQVQFKDQTPFQAIMANAGFALRCQVLFFGTALWGIAGNFFKFNDNLQQKYDAIFKGVYTYKLSPKSFQLDLSPIQLNIPGMAQPATLNSSWTNKSLTYKE